MSRNLHIFNDQLGFFSNKTVAYIETIYPDKNSYLNIAQDCKNRIDSIQYISIKEFLKKSNPVFNTIIFHSYNYANKDYIQKIKSRFPDQSLKFIWIFWSHEYYQLPEFFSLLYQGFSRRFYLRKIISFHVEHFILFLKGQVYFPFYLNLASFKKTFKCFDVMASLIKDDYNYVMEGVKGVDYSYVSYISLKDFSDIKNDLTIDKTDIMIGHSGSPILNHYEILTQLSDLRVTNKLLIPLSYGKHKYIADLKKQISENIHNLNIAFQTDYLTKQDYYKKINNVGYFILNSFCQQALGNIFFFLWTGTKVFLRKNTSSYKTFKNCSFYVFSIDDDLNSNELKPLSLEQKKYNQILVMSMINEETVKAAWLKLLRFNE